MKQNNQTKYRNSRQRQKILEILQSAKNHPTAPWIYEKLKKDFPTLSLGNVYRNLNILVEQGLIRELKFGSTFDRYDANVAPHYHFICDICGEIIDIEMEHEAHLNEKVERLTNFRVDHHRLEFYGQCDYCLNGKA